MSLQDNQDEVHATTVRILYNISHHVCIVMGFFPFFLLTRGARI